MRQRLGRPSWRRYWPGLLAASVVVLLAVELGCFAGEDAGAVRGMVVEVVDRNIIEIETLRIRDYDGELWTFATEGNLGKNGSHLRIHQLQGQSILVVWERRDGRLMAVQLGD